jgi:hypothetical protein
LALYQIWDLSEIKPMHAVISQATVCR